MSTPRDSGDDGPLAAARALLSRNPVLDGHNDLPWELRVQAGYDLAALDIARPQPSLQTDLARLRAGGVGGQFWSVYVDPALPEPAAVVATLEQIDVVHRLCARYPDALALARTADEAERALRGGRVASLLGAEGGHAIAGSLAVLRMLAALGVRYLTLTHNRSLEWADAALDEPRAGGLSAFGVEVVAELNRLGVLVDLSHTAETTMRAALAASSAPVIFSHSAARALCDHPRNVPDDVLTAMAAAGGVCMVTFVPSFVSAEAAAVDLARWDEERRLAAELPDAPAEVAARLARWSEHHPLPPVSVAQVADHIDHVREVTGVAHTGIGSDYDGCPQMPVGMADVGTGYPALVAELMGRGWREDELALLLHGNALRVLRDAEVVAHAPTP